LEVLRKRGVDIQPVVIEGRKIARTFWGRAWCDHLESFSDYSNRLPRGRTYVRNGSICHLVIDKGKIEALVSGTAIYNVAVHIKTLSTQKWNAVKKRCAGRIGSLLELLQGNLSDNVMTIVTDRRNGLFPLPEEISLSCDCPDWAVMCKHVAAVLYSVGARLDQQPEMLFGLRGVNHQELVDADAEIAVATATRSGTSVRLEADDLSEIFGIDIPAQEGEPAARKSAKKKSARKKTGRSGALKKSTVKRRPRKKK
jgi:uncharacterized Zn finger protein